MRSRREFLKFVAMAAGAGFAGWIPESIERAHAIEPEPGSTWRDAEHVVILMQENRSFDHAFGTLRGVRGFNDPRAMRLPGGNSVFVQTGGRGDSYAPWRLDIKDTRITWMGSLPHSRNSQIDAWNDGRHDGWLDAKRSGKSEYADLPLTMGHYTREDLPFYYALADAFTICDQHYCSVLSSTSPNRCYMWTGTIRDRQTADSRFHIRNEEIDDGGLRWKTFPERLGEAGISWKCYQNELTRSGLSGQDDAWLSNFSDNSLECFDAFNVEAYSEYPLAAKRWLAELPTKAHDLEAKIATAKSPAEAAHAHAKLSQLRARIEALQSSLPHSGEARYRKLSEQQKALFHAAFVTNSGDPDWHTLAPLQFHDGDALRTMMVPKGDVLYQFREDVNSGKLPAVSWLVASENFSDHPSAPWYGAWYLSEVLDILTGNPEIWKKTIFILTYDENDGYFDHAPSFVAADPSRPETGGASAGIDLAVEYTHKDEELKQGVAEADARSGPIGLGFRVPMIVASPWSRGGWVNSQVFDHTSTLMFLERFAQNRFAKAVREENISQWRRAVAGDLTSIFRAGDPSESQLRFLNRDKFVAGIEKARYKEIPSNYRKLTREQIDEIDRTPGRADFTAHQEEGVRPACALPYELYADGSLAGDGAHWELRLAAGNRTHGAASAGAPFNVYLRHLKDGDGFQAATFTIEAGDALTHKIALDRFRDGKYSIEVHGPNGFYRAFTGPVAARPAIGIDAAYERDASGPRGKSTGNLQLRLGNLSGNTVAVAIEDRSYGSKVVRKAILGGEATTVVLPLGSSHGWYDVAVKADGSDAEARYAGHVDSGEPSTSDPLMGGLA